MKIDFIGLGVQKAGTSTLHDILKQHTQIYLPVEKEVHFFDYPENYKIGIKWLKNRLPDAGAKKITGEFTPDYIYIDEVPGRIAETLGTDVKFIVVFRHPVDRAVSQYNMIYRKGLDSTSFYEAIKIENGRVKDSDFSNHNFSYMKRGLYFEQVKRYLDVFPAQNFIFLTFEKDIVKNIESTIKKIQQFLGVDEEKLDCSIISNEAFTPYSIKLNRLMRKNSTFTKKVKSLIPINLKAYVKNLVYKFNKKSNSKPLFALAKEERDKLFFDYFYQDVKLLENLTKVSFNNVWYHDKD